MKKNILFIQGAGEGAYEADRLLADSLQQALGSAYQIHYPPMPNDEGSGYPAWKAKIAADIAELDEPLIMVGHSFGSSVLLKYLSEQESDKQIAGLFLVASPYWGGDEDWDYDAVTLPDDLEARLAHIPRIFFYHSRDDEIVPFAHLALYKALLPQATIRETDGRGHQYGNDLRDVADDIISVRGVAHGR